MILESCSVTNETKISVFSTSTLLEVTKLSINSSEDCVRGIHTIKPPNFLLGLQDEALRLDLISLDNSSVSEKNLKLIFNSISESIQCVRRCITSKYGAQHVCNNGATAHMFAPQRVNWTPQPNRLV